MPPNALALRGPRKSLPMRTSANYPTSSDSTPAHTTSAKQTPNTSNQGSESRSFQDDSFNDPDSLQSWLHILAVDTHGAFAFESPFLNVTYPETFEPWQDMNLLYTPDQNHAFLEGQRRDSVTTREEDIVKGDDSPTPAFPSEARLSSTMPVGDRSPSSSLVILTPPEDSGSYAACSGLNNGKDTSSGSASSKQSSQQSAAHYAGPCSNTWALPQWVLLPYIVLIYSKKTTNSPQRKRKSRKNTKTKQTHKRSHDNSDNRPRRRALDEHERAETALTRIIGACIRCKNYKIRVSSPRESSNASLKPQ